MTDPAAVRREALEEATRIVEGCTRNGRSLPSEMAAAIREAATRPAEATGDAAQAATRRRLREIAHMSGHVETECKAGSPYATAPAPAEGTSSAAEPAPSSQGSTER